VQNRAIKIAQNRATQPGFTLIELLVVVTIIGLMAALSVPALKGFGQGNLINSVSRQLLDDIGYARSKAISDRCNVYVVFVSTNIVDSWNRGVLEQGLQAAASELPNVESSRFLYGARLMCTNLLQQQYAAYAIYADRTVGDQPSKKNPRYLSEWKTLPDGVIIHPHKMRDSTVSEWLNYKTNNYKQSNIGAPLPWISVHFPLAKGAEVYCPCIAFNYKGELIFPETGNAASSATFVSVPVSCDYEMLPIIKASTFYPPVGVSEDGYSTSLAPYVEVTPEPMVSTDPIVKIRIDGKTGKARMLKEEF